MPVKPQKIVLKIAFIHTPSDKNTVPVRIEVALEKLDVC
jgi:hypothetical protein